MVEAQWWEALPVTMQGTRGSKTGGREKREETGLSFRARVHWVLKGWREKEGKRKLSVWGLWVRRSKLPISGGSGFLWKLGKDCCHKGTPRKVLGRNNITIFSLGAQGDFTGVHNMTICPKYTSECYLLSAHMYISYKKNNANSKVKARAQVFGLPYGGLLIFGDRSQNSDHPWCVSWEQEQETLLWQERCPMAWSGAGHTCPYTERAASICALKIFKPYSV